MRGKIDRPLSPDQSQDLIDRIARDYSWSGIADRTLAVYQSVLK